MSKYNDNPSLKGRLTKDELRLFWRVFRMVKPYSWRLVVGALASLFGGGSIVAMLMAGQTAMSYVFNDGQDSLLAADAAAPAPAAEVAVVETAEPAPAAEPAAAEEPTPVEEVAAPAADQSLADKAKSKFAGKLLDQRTLDFFEHASTSRLVTLGLLFLLLTLANAVCQYGSMYYLLWVGTRVVTDLRIKLFNHLQELSLSFFGTMRGGDMISRTVADTSMIQAMVTNVIVDLIREPIKLLTILFFVVFIQWKLLVFALVLIPTVILPITVIGRRLRKISHKAQQRLADITNVMKESLDGVAVVKAFGQEARENARFEESSAQHFRQMVHATEMQSLPQPITHILGCIGGIAVLAYALCIHLPIEECLIFACAIFMMYDPLKKISRIAMVIQQSSASADRVFEVLDTPIAVKDAPSAKPVDGALSTIEFRDVDFAYGERKVFDKMNLTIHHGESLAVVGPSGGGKTTLVSLLLRFFDPQGGAVLRNGVDLRDVTMASHRARIGLVLQDTFLFNDTIAANIAYGKPDATREEIEAAAKLAHAHDFIVAKEDGYDTKVGERGASLSGGQKQRIAIARALIRNPELLILDEATSALDTDSERAVQAAIDDLMKQLTVVVIAHRLSTVAKCNRVAVIANGGVAEYGTHTELLANEHGIYHHLHSLQFAPAK